MAVLPTRRGLALVAVFVASLTLLFQFGLGTSESSHFPGLDWRGKIRVPWIDGIVKKLNVSDTRDAHGDSGQNVNYPVDVTGNARGFAYVWGDGKVPTTKIRVHVPGWTVFDRLYLLNGTVFIVTDKPKEIPDRQLLTSSGYLILNDPDDVVKRTPTDKDMQIISPQRAVQLFGSRASRVEGTSFVINDPPQFVKHYYHWSAELFFGLWKTYSTLDPNITSDGQTMLPAPRRIMMSRVPNADWRDYAAMNQWVTHSSFPSASLEFQEDWADRASMSHPFLLDRAVLADRAAAMHNPTFVLTQRTNAELFKLPGSLYWWSTIRNNVVEFAGGDIPDHGRKVITYISRQNWGRRMLSPEHHDRLVKALEDLRDRYDYEVNIVSMEDLSREDQIRLAARTTIMMGIHGNGLTSLIWMAPSRKATVMEFFYPGGFAHDYEWTTRALGMTHYGFWDNEYFTSPDLPPINYPEKFHDNDIPVDGNVVAQLCRERLSLPDN